MEIIRIIDAIEFTNTSDVEHYRECPQARDTQAKPGLNNYPVYCGCGRHIGHVQDHHNKQNS